MAQQHPVDIEITLGPTDWDVLVSWEPVTEDTNGDPYLPTDTISYDVFTRNANIIMDDQIIANLTLVAPVSSPSATVDFALYPRGQYYLGLRTVVEDGLGATEYSGVAWSWDQASVDPTQRHLYIVPGVLPVPRQPTGLSPGT